MHYRRGSPQACPHLPAGRSAHYCTKACRRCNGTACSSPLCEATPESTGTCCQLESISLCHEHVLNPCLYCLCSGMVQQSMGKLFLACPVHHESWFDTMGCMCLASNAVAIARQDGTSYPHVGFARRDRDGVVYIPSRIGQPFDLTGSRRIGSPGCLVRVPVLVILDGPEGLVAPWRLHVPPFAASGKCPCRLAATQAPTGDSLFFCFLTGPFLPAPAP